MFHNKKEMKKIKEDIKHTLLKEEQSDELLNKKIDELYNLYIIKETKKRHKHVLNSLIDSGLM